MKPIKYQTLKLTQLRKGDILVFRTEHSMGDKELKHEERYIKTKLGKNTKFIILDGGMTVERLRKGK